MNKLFEMEELPAQETKSTDEWYTPREVLIAVRDALGGSIDLDPASCELANQIVQAKRFYSRQENGLSQVWQARTVFLNPPYGKDNSQPNDNKSVIAMFVKKLLAEYAAGNIEQAILLSIVRTDTAWFPLLLEHSVCFPNHKIHFYKPKNGIVKKDSKHSHFFGSIFAYLGPNHQRFAEIFSEFGPVIPAGSVHRQPEPIPQPTLFDLMEEAV